MNETNKITAEKVNEIYTDIMNQLRNGYIDYSEGDAGEDSRLALTFLRTAVINYRNLKSLHQITEDLEQGTY